MQDGRAAAYLSYYSRFKVVEGFMNGCRKEKTGKNVWTCTEWAEESALENRKKLILQHPQGSYEIGDTGVFGLKASILSELNRDFITIFITVNGLKKFDYVLMEDRKLIIAHPEQRIQGKDQKILPLRVFYNRSYGYTPIIGPKKGLCLEYSLNLIKNSWCEHRYAARTLFGSSDDFLKVANNFLGDPFEIAYAYGVPLGYVLYELSKSQINRCHFRSCAGKDIIRHNGDNENKFENCNHDGLLIGLLNHLRPAYFGKLIYRESIFDNEAYVCFGWADKKRELKKIHVFGFPKEYATNSFNHNLRECAHMFDSQLMLE